jgi:hypothetical protein
MIPLGIFLLFALFGVVWWRLARSSTRMMMEALREHGGSNRDSRAPGPRNRVQAPKPVP